MLFQAAVPGLVALALSIWGATAKKPADQAEAAKQPNVLRIHATLASPSQDGSPTQPIPVVIEVHAGRAKEVAALLSSGPRTGTPQTVALTREQAALILKNLDAWAMRMTCPESQDALRAPLPLHKDQPLTRVVERENAYGFDRSGVTALQAMYREWVWDFSGECRLNRDEGVSIRGFRDGGGRITGSEFRTSLEDPAEPLEEFKQQILLHDLVKALQALRTASGGDQPSAERDEEGMGWFLEVLATQHEAAVSPLSSSYYY